MRTDLAGFTLFRSFANFAQDIKLSHSVFALPFALSEFFLLKIPSAELAPKLVLITICMICARSFAMGANRFVDARIDALNPRTSARMIPSGNLSRTQAIFWTVAFGSMFVTASFALSARAGFCSFGVLAILGAYPYWKRISWLTHWYLGLCLALVPVAVNIAMDRDVTYSALCLSGGILFWTAGFDVIYALMDFEYDQQFKIHSVPAVWGIQKALWFSRASYLICVLFFALFGVLNGFDFFYWTGLAVVAGLLAWQHILVRNIASGDGKNHLNAAFFNLNAIVSLIIFVSVICELLI